MWHLDTGLSSPVGTELIDTPFGIAAFAQDHEGEVSDILPPEVKD